VGGSRKKGGITRAVSCVERVSVFKGLTIPAEKNFGAQTLRRAYREESQRSRCSEPLGVKHHTSSELKANGKRQNVLFMTLKGGEESIKGYSRKGGGKKAR